MKSLSTAYAAAIDKPFPNPILLLTIEFSSPSSKTLYLCSRAFSPGNTYDGNVYDPLVKAWGEMRLGDIEPVRYNLKAGDVSFAIQNGVPVGGYDSFSELLAAFDWAFADVTFRQIDADAMAAADGATIFKGKIENLEMMTRSEINIRASGYELSFLNLWPNIVVNTTDYSGADPDDQGKMLAQVWGSCKRVPFRAVDAGGLTTAAEDIDNSETTIDATDTTAFPSSGTIQIDVEQMTYTGKTATSFTGVTRGTGGTTAVEHDLGANIAEIQASYVYIMGHAVKAFNGVYVDGVLQPTGNYTAYTGQVGDQLAGYGALAVIEFSTLPSIVKQTNVDVNDTIAVSD
ncbi:MAG: hypothetical protein JRJ54_15590, partial [Deltaproteobacteria bacterium]|nr:hypothetical protein [Deltaproteobacteria bacterium]